MDGVQKLVDALAEQLQRSVAVDDPNICLVASSRHFGDEDQVRVTSLVGRRPVESAIEHVFAHGVRSLQRPARIPGNSALDLKPRICVPLRRDAELLGFLWLIDDDALTQDDMDTVLGVADRIAVLLAAGRRAERDQAAEREQLVREVVADDPTARQRAARAIVEQKLLPAGYRYVALVAAAAQPAVAGEMTDFFRTRGSLRPAFLGEGTVVPVTTTVADTVVALTALRRPITVGQGEVMANRLLEWVRRGADVDRSLPIVVGLGAAADALDEVWQSYEQAVRATEAARLSDAPVACWEAMTPPQVVAALTPGRIPDHLAPPLLRKMRERLSPEFLETLRVFLDCAGDAARAAEQRHVHRSTVYYRISRIEDVLGVSFADGRARTAAHWCLLTDQELRSRPPTCAPCSSPAPRTRPPEPPAAP